MNTTTATPVRPIHEIAAEIKKLWTNVYFGAKPYLDAMFSLQDANSTYGCDSAKSIVLYFLANANTWRDKKGEDNAKRIKAELKKLVGIK